MSTCLFMSVRSPDFIYFFGHIQNSHRERERERARERASERERERAREREAYQIHRQIRYSITLTQNVPPPRFDSAETQRAGVLVNTTTVIYCCLHSRPPDDACRGVQHCGGQSGATSPLFSFGDPRFSTTSDRCSL